MIKLYVDYSPYTGNFMIPLTMENFEIMQEPCYEEKEKLEVACVNKKNAIVRLLVTMYDTADFNNMPMAEFFSNVIDRMKYFAEDLQTINIFNWGTYFKNASADVSELFVNTPISSPVKVTPSKLDLDPLHVIEK